jgi:hypothetical protein
MSRLIENKLGYIDIYHGKVKADGNSKAPDFEGQIKLTDGTIIRFKTWSELKEGLTNNQRFSGYLYQLSQE